MPQSNLPNSRTPGALHEEYTTLAKTKPSEAKRLKQANPGVGCVWVQPNIPGTQMLLVDPETRACVHDQFGAPVTSPPGMNQAPKKGVNPPPPQHVARGGTQDLLIDGGSLCSAIKPNSACAQLAKKRGFKIVSRGRKVTINGPTPITITSEQARKLGILPKADAPLKALETWFEGLELEKVGWAAIQPIPDAFAVVIEGIYIFIEKARASMRQSVFDMFRQLPNARNWTATRNGRTLRLGTPAWAVNYLAPRDRPKMNVILRVIETTHAPADAIKVDINGSVVSIRLVHAEGYCVPPKYADKTWNITVLERKSPSKPTDIINRLRSFSGVPRQQLEEHPVLSTAYAASSSVRDLMIVGAVATTVAAPIALVAGTAVATGGGGAVAIGAAVVGFLAFMGAVSRNKSRGGVEFWLKTIADTLADLTRGKLAAAVAKHFNFRAYGKWVGATIEAMLKKVEDLLGTVRLYINDLLGSDDAKVAAGPT